MRHMRNGGRKDAVAKDAPSVAREWRKRLRIEGQHQPDIAAILARPKTAFPNIKVRTFPASAYPKQRVRGWANTQTRTINIADDVETGLKYGDPKSRWEATHELAHIALRQPGNNLLSGKPYLIEDRKFEEQVDIFIFEFLAPFDLAKHLSTAEEYERRFGIPHDKAIIRKHQIDQIKDQLALSMGRQLLEKTEEKRQQVGGRPAVRRRKTAPPIQPEQFYLPFPPKAEQVKPLQNVQHAIANGITSTSNGQVSTNPNDCPKELLDGARADPDARALSEDEEVVRILVRDANKRIARYRRSIKLGIGVLTLALMGGLPLLTDAVDGKIKITALATSGIIGAALSFLQIFDHRIGLDRRIEALAWKSLIDIAESRGLSRKLARYNVCYQQDRFVIR